MFLRKIYRSAWMGGIPCYIFIFFILVNAIFQYAQFQLSYNNQFHKQILLIFMDRKKNWTKEEDLLLQKLVSGEEKTNWNEVMEKLNSSFPAKSKSVEECKDRYINELALDRMKQPSSEWKPEDLDVLYSEFDKYGTKWTKIAQAMPGKYIFMRNRSQNSIKNKFYSSLRKVIRKFNIVGKTIKKKMKKNIRYESLVRIMEAAETFLNLSPEMKQESLDLRQRILKLMRQQALNLSQDEIYEIINRINKFNLATRSYKPRKVKKVTEKPSVIIKKSKEEEDKLNIKQEETDDNCWKKTAPINTIIFSPNGCFNLSRNIDKEVKKQNIQESMSKIKEFPIPFYHFSPYVYIPQCAVKTEPQEQIDYEMLAERESPLNGSAIL